MARVAAVVGLGLIGGSLARDLSAQGVRVLGWDVDAEHLAGALDAGVVAAALDASLNGLEQAEIVVLAVPVGEARDLLQLARPHLLQAKLITDAGSTKRGIVEAAESLGIGDRFVGSHPLAGSERSGWRAARTGLFADARVFVCPTSTSTADAVALAYGLWKSLGARPELIDARTHDERVAWTSHLPQLASTALALVLGDALVPPGELGPGGRDMTRLAASSPGMWGPVVAENADHLEHAVRSLESRLAELRALLRARDAEALRALFEAGADWTRNGGGGGQRAGSTEAPPARA